MVAYYPDRAGSLEVARGLADGGCSYLEVQFPFSDPTADGPDIQRACGAALDAGFTVNEGFGSSRRSAAVRAPLFVMSYANLLFTRGVKRFLRGCSSGGARCHRARSAPRLRRGTFQERQELGLVAMPVLSPSMREERLARVSSLRRSSCT